MRAKRLSAKTSSFRLEPSEKSDQSNCNSFDIFSLKKLINAIRGDLSTINACRLRRVYLVALIRQQALGTGRKPTSKQAGLKPQLIKQAKNSVAK
jgi:hypothetical protein